MMEIKFRAWDKNTSTMFEHEELLRCGHYDLILNSEIDYDLMQFTGLRDRNGKEIYEGDIVKMHSEFYNQFGDEGNNLDRDYIGEVVFIPSKGACIKNIKWYCHLSDTYGTDKRYKQITARRSDVIGNVHENPELLTVNKTGRND